MCQEFIPRTSTLVLWDLGYQEFRELVLLCFSTWVLGSVFGGGGVVVVAGTCCVCMFGRLAVLSCPGIDWICISDDGMVVGASAMPNAQSNPRHACCKVPVG